MGSHRPGLADISCAALPESELNFVKAGRFLASLGIGASTSRLESSCKADCVIAVAQTTGRTTMGPDFAVCGASLEHQIPLNNSDHLQVAIAKEGAEGFLARRVARIVERIMVCCKWSP